MDCDSARTLERCGDCYQARSGTRSSRSCSRGNGRSSGASNRTSGSRRSSGDSSGRDFGSYADSYGGGIGGCLSRTGDRGLGLWDLGSIQATGGICTMLHIEGYGTSGNPGLARASGIACCATGTSVTGSCGSGALSTCGPDRERRDARSSGLVGPDELDLYGSSVADESDEVTARADRSAGVIEAVPDQREGRRRDGRAS